MLAIVATLKAKPGQGEALVTALQAITPEVRKEPGNHAYTVHQASDDADTIVMYEQYADEAALAAHGKHLKDIGGAVNALLAGRPDIRVLKLRALN